MSQQSTVNFASEQEEFGLDSLGPSILDELILDFTPMEYRDIKWPRIYPRTPWESQRAS